MGNFAFMNGHNEFLVGLEKVHREILENRRRTASQFNVFDALRLTSLELPHSTFLRFLLAPDAQHGQGALFLKAFLDRIVKIESEHLEGTLVVSERVLGDSGRIDIAIHLPNDRIVLIENKVEAGEGEAQIERYLDWLKQQKRSVGREHKLIFLTSNGKIPISTKTPDKVIPVSYCDIADWLSSVTGKVPERLRTVIGQYIETCLYLGGKMQDDTMALKNFLKEPQNLELGFDVSKIVEDISREAHHEFWKNVESELNRRVKDDKARLWEAFDNQSNNGLLGITWKNGRNGSDSFSVSFETRGGLTYYGICRGKKVPVPDPLEVNIVSQLKKEGFLTSDAYWLGKRYLHNHDQAFAPNSEKKAAIALLSDNLSQGHPLAAKIADVAWELFLPHQKCLEALNSSYPY